MFELTAPSLESAFRLDVDQLRITGQTMVNGPGFGGGLFIPGPWWSGYLFEGTGSRFRTRLVSGI